MINIHSKSIINPSEVSSQDESEISFSDRGLRLLARMIARELMLRGEEAKIRDKTDDLSETRGGL